MVALASAVGLVATVVRGGKSPLETTGTVFAARVADLRGQVARAEAEIARIERTTFDDIAPIVATTSFQADMAMGQAQARRRAPLIATQRARIRTLTAELDQVHRVRAEEVSQLRVETALGTTPADPALPDHWSADARYMALCHQRDELKTRHATLVEEHGLSLSRSEEATTKLRESAVARQLGETTSAKHAKAEKARDEATAALAAVAEQLDVHRDALVRIERQRAALEVDVRARWVDALTTAHRETVQRFAAHLRAAAAAAPALDRLATLLEREGAGPTVTVRAPGGFDVANANATIRRWLDLAIEQRLLN